MPTRHGHGAGSTRVVPEDTPTVETEDETEASAAKTDDVEMDPKTPERGKPSRTPLPSSERPYKNRKVEEETKEPKDAGENKT